MLLCQTLNSLGVAKPVDWSEMGGVLVGVWSIPNVISIVIHSPSLQDRTTPFLKTRPWARRPGSWTWAVGCNLAVTSSWLQSKSICIWINIGFLINFWVVTFLSSKSGIFVCHFGCPVVPSINLASEALIPLNNLVLKSRRVWITLFFQLSLFSMDWFKGQFTGNHRFSH